MEEEEEEEEDAGERQSSPLHTLERIRSVGRRYSSSSSFLFLFFLFLLPYLKSGLRVKSEPPIPEGLGMEIRP